MKKFCSYCWRISVTITGLVSLVSVFVTCVSFTYAIVAPANVPINALLEILYIAIDIAGLLYFAAIGFFLAFPTHARAVIRYFLIVYGGLATLFAGFLFVSSAFDDFVNGYFLNSDIFGVISTILSAVFVALLVRREIEAIKQRKR